MDVDGHEQSFGIDQNMPFASDQLFGAIVAPFSLYVQSDVRL